MVALYYGKPAGSPMKGVQTVEDKLIYEFPQKLSRTQRQAKAFNDIAEHKKLRGQMYKNIAIGAGMVALSFLIKFVIVKMLIILIGVGNIIVGLLLYRYYTLSRDTALYTRIYEQHLEHCQNAGLMGDKLQIRLFYDEIEKSWQDNRGRLIVELKNTERSTAVRTDKKGSEKGSGIKDNTLVLKFVDTASKLKLLNDMHEQIHYPKKDYKVIEDDDDYYSEEDMKWDKLHKHGL